MSRGPRGEGTRDDKGHRRRGRRPDRPCLRSLELRAPGPPSAFQAADDTSWLSRAAGSMAQTRKSLNHTLSLSRARADGHRPLHALWQSALRRARCFGIFPEVLDSDLVGGASGHVAWLVSRHPELRPEQLHHDLITDDPFWLCLVGDDGVLDIAGQFTVDVVFRAGGGPSITPTGSAIRTPTIRRA